MEQGELSKQEAEEEAFRIQLNEVAIINRAIDIGIEVSKEEALQVANKTRQVLEQGDSNGFEGTQEALMEINDTLEREGISEEEYWNDYVINSYKQMLMRERLMQYERDNNPQKNWNERQEEIIEEFKSKEERQINKFKKEVGMSK